MMQKREDDHLFKIIMKFLLLILALSACTSSFSIDYRVPLPDLNDSDALRHYFYDIVRTVANGLVDGYNRQTTYFSDLDCYNESFQLTTQDFLASGLESILYFKWIRFPVSTWQSLKTFLNLWREEVYRCGKEFSSELVTFVRTTNPLLALVTVSVRLTIFAPLFVLENIYVVISLVTLNVYGVFKSIGRQVELLISKHPLNMWEN